MKLFHETVDSFPLELFFFFFSAIHLSDVDDVRPTLQYYSQFDDPLKEFRERATRVAELVIIFECDIIYYVAIV